MAYSIAESHPLVTVQTNGQVAGTTTTPTAPASTLTPQGQQQQMANQSQQQAQTQNQNCGFFCKLGNWLGGDGFKTDAEVTEDRRQWLLDHATNDPDKDKIRAASADKVNNTFECLQSASCAAKFQAYVEAATAVAGTASQIANGHQGEFPGWGQSDFEGAINSTMQNPDEVRSLSNGRTAYWNASEKMVVIEDPANPDGGTAFRPTNGKTYFDGLN